VTLNEVTTFKLALAEVQWHKFNFNLKEEDENKMSHFRTGNVVSNGLVVWSSRRTFLSHLKKGSFLEKEILEHTMNSKVLSFQIVRRNTSSIKLMVGLNSIFWSCFLIEVMSLKTLQ
jgi:hypothetical protein